MNRIGVISLGCAKNQVNTEQMMWSLRDAGYSVSGEVEGADVALINTCGFIESAKQEAIEHILALGLMKKEGTVGSILVAGCLSERYKDELLAELPEVDGIIGCGGFSRVTDAVAAVLEGSRPRILGDLNAPVDETPRILTTPEGWAYLKIAEGCDNRCSFCVIPDLRGRYRSRPQEAILKEAGEMAADGVRELIVVAQDITRYGTDLYGERRLPDLLEALCRIDGFRWIRLHYLYPDEFSDRLIDLIAGEEKILPYLDIPIQHINDKILTRMNRRGTGNDIRVLFAKLRERIPGLVLRTSLITGLPGEGEAEYEELRAFLRRERIERAGVFPYSPEEGTPAARMADRVTTEEAVLRAEKLMELQNQIMDDFDQSRVGRITQVLTEGFDPDQELYYGRSYAESPDIDGVIYFEGMKTTAAGIFEQVEITRTGDGAVFGRARKG